VLPLFAEQPFFRCFAIVQRLNACAFALLVDRGLSLATPPAADRNVERDAIQPRVKRAVPLERIELEECLHEGLLDHVLGFLAPPRDVQHRIEEAVLVFTDHLPKRLSVAAQGIIDELCVVSHNRSDVGTHRRGKSSPAGQQIALFS
jgi:hypothetical protein